MNEPSDIRSLLKQATVQHHARIEDESDLMRGDLTRGEYENLLKSMYGFYKPWEAMIRPVLLQGGLDFYEGRLKLPLIEQDLAFFGHSAAEMEDLPLNDSLPPVHTVPEALGSTYVIEGSTLGGKFLAKHFSSLLDLTPETGCAFYSAYGKKTAAQWAAFGDILQQHATQPYEPVIAAAAGTFDAMTRWIAQTA